MSEKVVSRGAPAPGGGWRPVNETLPPVLLLDLDDTIVSFSVGPRNFWLEAFQAHQARCGRLSAASFLEAIERTARWYWSDPERAHQGRVELVRARREIVALALPELHRDDPELTCTVADHLTREKERAVAPFPGAVEALKALRGRGVRLGLVTNGSGGLQRAKLERFDLEPFFDVVVIEGEAGFGKPDPRIFRLALERLSVTAEQAWMVGDNLYADIEGAKQVGMRAVWIDHTGGGPGPDCAVRPDGVIRGLLDLAYDQK